MAKTAKTHKEMLRKQTTRPLWELRSQRGNPSPQRSCGEGRLSRPKQSKRKSHTIRNINFSNFSKETLNFLKRAANFSRKRAEKTELEQSYKALEKAENIRKHANHHTRRNRH